MEHGRTIQFSVLPRLLGNDEPWGRRFLNYDVSFDCTVLFFVDCSILIVWCSNSTFQRLRRRVSQTKAMGATSRYWGKLTRFSTCCRRKLVDDTASFQYRIPPRNEKQGWWLTSWTMAGERMFSSATRFFNERTFSTLLLCFIALYFLFIFIFAFIIQGLVLAYDNSGVLCITVFDYISGNFGANFLRSFDLSWTTFSTVASVFTRYVI